MLEIKIDLREVNAEFMRLQHRISDSSDLMSNVAALLESMTQQAFIDEGPGWQDLAQSTKDQRTKKGSWPGRILDVSGATGLKGSVFGDSGNGWAQVGAGSAKSAAYAMIHQEGGMAGKGKKTEIPARPYMPIAPGMEALTDDAEKSLIELTLEYFQT